MQPCNNGATSIIARIVGAGFHTARSLIIEESCGMETRTYGFIALLQSGLA
jgi:hypothetical protein